MASTIAFLTDVTLDANSNADNATGWTGGSLDTSNKIQGTGCIGVKQVSGINAIYFTNSVAVDMTASDRHFYIWGLAAGAAKLDTKANGGVRIRLGSSATNYNEWYMDGSDTYTGGWKCWMINPQADPDAIGGTGATLTSITVFGITFNTTGTFTGNNLTLFADVCRVGTGLRVTATSSSTGFEDIFSADNNSSNEYGVISKVGGVYFVQGQLVFGDTSTATNPNFQDTGKTVVFRDNRVSPTLYKINLVGNAGDTTSNAFQLGSPIGSGSGTIGSKGVTITSSGSATSTGSYTYNNASPATITRSTGSFKTDGLEEGMLIQISGTTSNNKNVTSAKVAALTITLSAGETLAAEGPVSSTLTGTRRFDFTVTDTNVKSLKLYGSTLKQAGTISLGSTSTAISPTLEIVDTIFTDTRQIVRNVTTASPLYIRNAVNFNTNLTASMNLYDAKNTDSTTWNVLQGPGFQATLGGTQTLNLTGYNFGNATTPYISLLTNQTWNSINPTWTITDQTQLNFGGSTLTGAAVNEKFQVSATVQQPDGTKLQNARVKLTEQLPSPAIANEVATDVNGLASFQALTRNFVGAASNALTTTTYSTFALKTYYYGKLPFVGSQTITAAVSPGVTLLPDTFQAQTSQSSAITLGDTTNNVQVIDDSAAGDSILILKYTAGVNTLTTGQTILSSGSGTWRGTVQQIIEGSSASGTIVVRYSSGVVFSDSAGTLDNTPSTGTWSATYTVGSVKRFAFGINASTLSAQQLYDYVNAKLADTTLDTAKKFDKMVIWGKSSQAIPIQGSGSKFKTVRNDSTSQQGWVIWNLGGTGLAGIDVYTANDGTTFTPQATITLSLTNVVVGSECEIFQTSNTANKLLGPVTAASSTVSASYTWTSSIDITIRVRQSSTAPKYLPYEAGATLATGVDFTQKIEQTQDTIA